MKKQKEVTKMNTENISGKVVELAGMVDYQSGSIVSRTVIDKPSGTLTLFAFDKWQGLSEHTAPYDALVYLLDGEAEITISGKPHTVKKDEIIIMPANAPHALRASNRFKMMLVMIKS
jgi:quercetin dioxygenase-like cupin family protein